MKKLLSTLAMSALVASAANAQAVLGYSLSESQGTYTPLTDATVIFDAAGNAETDLEGTVFIPTGSAESSGSSQGFSLGFEMNVAGTTYTDFVVSGAGYLYLGNGEIAYNTNMKANFMTYSGDYNCFGLAVNKGVSCLTDTKISYKTLGEGDDARLVVQFEKFGICYNFWDEGTPVDMQLIMDKKGNASLVLSGLSSLPDDSANYQVYIGLRQGENYICATGASGSLTALRNDRENAIFTASTPDGTTVTFETPKPCVKPQAQPTALELTSTSDEIEGSFTAAADADNYLVVYTVGEGTVGVPVDGTTYAVDEKLGDATVAYFGPETSFEMRNLEGGKDYNYTIYAANAFGLNGPVYNTEAPLTGSVATKPAPVAGVELVAATVGSMTLNVKGNEADDEVVVLYNTYCERDNYGDHGLFGEIPADAKAGDVLPAPADFTPLWNYEGVPKPANSGTVAYIGKAGEAFTIEGLTSGTNYYLVAYTRNAQGVYTSEPLYTAYSTNIENPYKGDSFNFPRYTMPGGWSTSPQEGSTIEFRDEAMWDRATQAPSQGTQIMQFHANLNRGDAVNGKEAWMTTPPVVINDRHLMAKYDYCMTVSEGRFSKDPYNNWTEGDQLQIRLSEDNGETWTVVAAYTDAEHPTQAELLSYVSLQADLNDYRGKTVLLQLYWKTFCNAGFGAHLYVDRFSLLQGEFPAVPEVTVAKITHDSAVVSWVSQQTDYELVYNKVGSNVSHTVKVEGASSYTLEGLEPNTEYTVKVRGLLAGEEEAYSEWSDPVVFTTADYPAVDAPENLKADTETFAALGYVQLSWDKAVDALSYEVAYRLASSTEWIYKNCESTSLLLTELEGGQNYVWKVRAFCTHDRETSYSAQARFTAPQMSGVADVAAEGAVVTAGAGYIAVEGAQGASVAVYSASGVQVASTASAAANERYELAAGLYIVAVGNHSYKVVVK